MVFPYFFTEHDLWRDVFPVISIRQTAHGVESQCQKKQEEKHTTAIEDVPRGGFGKCSTHVRYPRWME
jgi:hypothetical protein